MDLNDPNYDPDAAVRQATARIGGLSTWGRTPEPAEKAEALRRLAVARIDREIRDQARKGIRLEGLDVAHLVGLLLSNAGVKYDAATSVERVVREVAQSARAERDD